MDGKGAGFFLGVLATVVLFLLWKKERHFVPVNFPGLTPPATPATPPNSGARGGCGCGGRSPSAAASPSAQGAGAGMISPGTPPLQGTYGVGSFYSDMGPTGDETFTNVEAAPLSPTITAAPRTYNNVAGSPTTPANQVPVRARQPVGSYDQTGFASRYNFVGVPAKDLN